MGSHSLSSKRGLQFEALGSLAALVIEIFVYLNYFAHEARFHWFTHFYAGGAVALLSMAIIAPRLSSPIPFPVLWVVLGHLLAMFPDFLFEAGIAHRRWMDVFLGHLSSHFIPGRNWAWYGIFVAALTVYLLRGRTLSLSTGRRSSG